MMKMSVQRRFAVLVSLAICAFSWSALGAPSGAEPLSVALTASAGYECASPASLVTAKPGLQGTIAVHLSGFVVTYKGKEAHLATGLFSYPGAVTVTGASRTWPLPPPANPRDQYFQLWALCAIQFVAGTAPDVLAEGYWGGAHCCYGPTLYRYSAGAYRVLEDLTKPGVGKGLHWNPNSGFEPKKVGGMVVLESSDGAFPYTFGCYACTPAPTRLFVAGSTGLVDVTARHPVQILSEASAAWASANQSMRSSADAGQVEGPLAEWAADKCEVGEGAQMWHTLEQLQAEGKLAAAEQQSLNNKEPFPAQLKTFLLGHGYCQGQL